MLLTTVSTVLLWAALTVAILSAGVLVALIVYAVRDHRKGGSAVEWPFDFAAYALLACIVGLGIFTTVQSGGEMAAGITHDLNLQGFTITSIETTDSGGGDNSPTAVVTINNKLQVVRLYQNGSTKQWHAYTSCQTTPDGHVNPKNCVSVEPH